MSSDPVYLGFAVSQLHPDALLRQYFPSKIGGSPAWLSAELPSGDELKCKHCGDNMRFLAQIYAPMRELDTDRAFHRTLFLFACAKATCLLKKSAVVLRSQLPLRNEFFDEEAPDFPDADLEEAVEFDDVSRDSLQIPDFDFIEYPQFDISTEEDETVVPSITEVAQEEDSKRSGISKLTPEERAQANEALRQYTEAMKDQNSDVRQITVEELEQYENRSRNDDMEFERFQRVVKHHPEQVLRYQPGGVALWAGSSDKASVNENDRSDAALQEAREDAEEEKNDESNAFVQVPVCSLCGADRQFEFQLMPTFMSVVGVGFAPNDMDFGTIAVYTCSQSCDIGNKYVTEYAHVQRPSAPLGADLLAALAQMPAHLMQQAPQA
ncbi:MAG: hypothetical protein MHM6MM_002077 [Cercozoa sp. M6MM]